MYSCVLTFCVCHPAVYLPHLDQPSECVFVWEEERLCLYVSVPVVFVYICFTYGAGWVQYCAV